MNILVTGVSGFIGGALARELRSRGHAVTGLVRDPARAAGRDLNGITLIGGDLARAGGLDAAGAAIATADAVAHLAAVRRDWDLSDEALRRVNVTSGADLVALATAARRFLFVSSVAVYGHPVGGPGREDSPFAPSKRYGVSKVEAESAIRAATTEAGMALTIARPGITYGPGDTYGMVANMARLLARRRFLLVGAGTNRVNLLYIDDLARALADLLLEPRAAGRDVILTGPDPVPVGTLARTLGEIVGRPLPPVRVPEAPVRAAAFVLERLWRTLGRPGEPFLTRAKVDLLTREDIYDTARARDLIGFAPRTGLPDGLTRTVRWLDQQGELR